MKRYLICPVIGDGSEEDPWRASVDPLEVPYQNIIPADVNTGVPTFGFCFAIVSSLDWNSVLQLTNSLLFPDFPLDVAISSMEPSALAALKQSAEAYDLDGNGLHLNVDISDTSISYRTLITNIGLQFSPSFNINSFSCSEAIVE